ncbi:MAG: thioredoxin family protein [Spirochaetales bacterium]|nr:thioredoxin family protein [Spirochaetales bacterium]
MKRILTILLLICPVFVFAENITELEIGPEVINGNSAMFSVTAKISIPPGLHATYNPDYLNIRLASPLPGLSLSENVYPEAEERVYYNPITRKREKIREYNGTILVEALLRKDISLSEGNHPIQFVVSYQLCDDSVCYPPEEAVHTVFLSESGPGPAISGPGFLKILLYLLLAFAGGIILNLTPCVLPVLSVKALHLLKQSNMDRRKILNNSLVYSTGVLLSMLVLALVTIILKISGEYAGFSFQNQDPRFNNFLVILIFSFALSLFDIYTVRLPGMTRAANASAREGYSGSFFSGVFAILLGVSCTAPLLAPALGFAFSLPYFWIPVFFLVTGAGLAFPFLLLGIFPAVIQKFPKPGKWMDTFRIILAFGLMLFAVDRLRIIMKLTGTIIPQLFYLLAAGFGLWLYGQLGSPRYKIRTNIIALVIALVIVVGGFMIVTDADRLYAKTNQHNSTRAPWQEFSPRLLEYLRMEGKPVFVDFTADWCLNCQINKRLVLHTKEIENLFIHYDVELLSADFTAKDNTIAEMLVSLGKAGVPVYAFYAPGADTPVFLPELLTKKMIYDLLEQYEEQMDMYRLKVPQGEFESVPLPVPLPLPETR